MTHLEKYKICPAFASFHKEMEKLDVTNDFSLLLIDF